MSKDSSTANPGDAPYPSRFNISRYRNTLGILMVLLAVLALLAPLFRAEVQGRVGVLLLLAAVMEIAHGFRQTTAGALKGLKPE